MSKTKTNQSIEELAAAVERLRRVRNGESKQSVYPHPDPDAGESSRIGYSELGSYYDIQKTSDAFVDRVFTDAQCYVLNTRQHDRSRHPYTCGNDSRHRPLIATPAGWRCADCCYQQDWAHEEDKLGPPKNGG